jgi:hypothetical protein
LKWEAFFFTSVVNGIKLPRAIEHIYLINYLINQSMDEWALHNVMSNNRKHRDISLRTNVFFSCRCLYIFVCNQVTNMVVRRILRHVFIFINHFNICSLTLLWHVYYATWQYCFFSPITHWRRSKEAETLDGRCVRFVKSPIHHKGPIHSTRPHNSKWPHAPLKGLIHSKEPHKF